MSPWRLGLSWAFLAAGAVSWAFAAHRAWSQGALGIPGLAWILNGLLAFCGALSARASGRHAAEAATLAAALRTASGHELALAQRNAALQAQVELLSAMREVHRGLGAETRFEPVVTRIFGILADLLAPEAVGLYLPEAGGGLRLAAARLDGRIAFAQDGRPPAGAEGLDPAVADAAWAERRLHREGQALAVPLAVEEAALGILALRLPASAGEDAAEQTLRDLARPLAIALHQPSLRNAAETDALTGLFTKRHLMARAPALLAQQQARGTDLALLMVDLDHFKAINDTHGHPAGDRVLKEVAARIAATVRGSDTAYRFGGEEIACLLPGAGGAVAMRVAGRIRRAIGEQPVSLGEGLPGLPVTASVGVAALTPEMTTWEALLSAADQALYQAKAAGRDRAVLFKEKR